MRGIGCPTIRPKLVAHAAVAVAAQDLRPGADDDAAERWIAVVASIRSSTSWIAALETYTAAQHAVLDALPEKGAETQRSSQP